MKKRLLYFCSDYIIGLTQAQTEQLEHLVNEDSIDLFAISSEKEQEKGLHERLHKAGVDVTVIKDLDVHKDFKNLARKIGKILEEKDITHVNVHNNWQLGLMAYLKFLPSFKHKFKLIYTIHGYRHNNPVKSVIAVGVIGTSLALSTDRVISMSNYVSRKFQILSFKTDRVFYLMNKPEYKKTANKVDISTLSMVFPAQFRKGKRQDILVNAVNEYIKRTGDKTIQLHLPGDGPLLEDLKEMVEKLGLQENIHFYGKISLSEVIALYEKNNIALCSSNVETYGRCIAEPFMLGRCVITQKTGVAEDIIRNGENGFFFKTAVDLTNILEYLHLHPNKIKAIADKAFEDRVVFFPENVMKSYLQSLDNA